MHVCNSLTGGMQYHIHYSPALCIALHQRFRYAISGGMQG